MIGSLVASAAASVAAWCLLAGAGPASAFSPSSAALPRPASASVHVPTLPRRQYPFSLRSTETESDCAPATALDDDEEEEDDDDDGFDPVITLKPVALDRLRELRLQRPDPAAVMILRMGVRSGGCSGMSYSMDFTDEGDLTEEDVVDEYAAEGIRVAVDPKSVLYLYGMELDYSTELVGG
eukprot:CAMPEP_0194267280 /NCGR_PEP_ID=MMETSP0169-20130528/1852_1 /TAXON_ID=218684 /ORGANISM="Corethron pennatum, Strain L29A3" /LENGTH=180 /DNA_ID=CAMNT_0039008099 /DNA_START=81 /DNA_END=620 /DNA_ORIENTATION=+